MTSDLGIIARKKCLALAGSLLKAPHFFAEPIDGVAEPEINYYGFTLVNALNSSPVNAIKLSGEVSGVILPTVWNYLDGACSIAVGLTQLLDEDNYRQTQMRAKGLLNIMSGIQLFVFSYNPALVAALGITGAPAALAGSAFALATLVDLITASIDLYNAYKEKEIHGWLEEKCKEYTFISNRIKALEEENTILEASNRGGAQWALEVNNSKIAELKDKNKKLKEEILLRYRVNSRKNLNETLLTDTFPDLSVEELLREEISESEELKDANIQKALDNTFQKVANTVLVKGASLIGMALLAVGTFALYTVCPPAVAATGLAITVVVAAIYIYRHQQGIINKLSTMKKSAISFFQSTTTKDAEVNSDEQVKSEDDEESDDKDSPIPVT